MTPDQAREIAQELVECMDDLSYRSLDSMTPRERFTKAIVDALLSATKAERLAEREECAKVADAAAEQYSRESSEAKQAGKMDAMYQVNNAWHAAFNIAYAIRSRSDDTPASDGKGDGK